MKEIAWYDVVDGEKEDWPDGPWKEGEPDKKQWVDEETGFACLLKRNRFGTLCGYVGVEPGHPWYEEDFDEIDVEVHGGLTYAGLCEPGLDKETICHVTEPGDPDPLYWLGFDTGHFMDHVPLMDEHEWKARHGLEMIYRDQEYVEHQCTLLARQIKAAE